MSFSASHKDTSDGSTKDLEPQYAVAMNRMSETAARALADAPFRPYSGTGVTTSGPLPRTHAATLAPNLPFVPAP